jgi:uncharacterized protein YndB with AHSA1/START domain
MTTKNELAEAIVIERTLNAPVAKVWQALTEVEQMRQWYFDLKELRPEPALNLSLSSSTKAPSITTFAK